MSPDDSLFFSLSQEFQNKHRLRQQQHDGNGNVWSISFPENWRTVRATLLIEHCGAADFLARMQGLDAPGFTSERMDTDHSFNSQRIALQALILRWADAQHLSPIAVQ